VKKLDDLGVYDASRKKRFSVVHVYPESAGKTGGIYARVIQVTEVLPVDPIHQRLTPSLLDVNWGRYSQTLLAHQVIDHH
jgi:hypothetical protein